MSLPLPVAPKLHTATISPTDAALGHPVQAVSRSVQRIKEAFSGGRLLGCAREVDSEASSPHASPGAER